jgi:branched-chain amino acid transport system permease protein
MTSLALAQILLNGLALGAAYALIALGFVIVINAVGAVNFAQGELVMAGGFAAIALATLVGDAAGLPGLLLLPLVMLLMGGLGVGFAHLAYFPLRKRPQVAVFVSTIAIGLVLQHLANAVFGAAPRVGPPLIAGDGPVVGGLTLSLQQLGGLGSAALLVSATGLFLGRTQTGRRMRAVAQDPEMAAAIGIRPARMVTLSFALAVALAGAAGLLLSNQFFVSPNDGGLFMLKAYIAVTIGGWGRLDGAVLGALLIGLFETLVAAFTSYLVAEALLYGVLLAMLAFRPSGLLPERARSRV